MYNQKELVAYAEKAKPIAKAPTPINEEELDKLVDAERRKIELEWGKR